MTHRHSLAAAHFVQDPAGLLISEVVHPPALQSAEQVERSAREPGADPERLQRGNQRVPPEERHEPGQAGCREDVALAEEVAGDPQRREVDNRPPQDAGQHCALGLEVRSARASRSTVRRRVPAGRQDRWPLARTSRCSPSRRPSPASRASSGVTTRGPRRRPSRRCEAAPERQRLLSPPRR